MARRRRLARAIRRMCDTDAEWMRSKLRFVSSATDSRCRSSARSRRRVRSVVTLTGWAAGRRLVLAASDLLLSPHVANADGAGSSIADQAVRYGDGAADRGLGSRPDRRSPSQQPYRCAAGRRPGRSETPLATPFPPGDIQVLWTPSSSSSIIRDGAWSWRATHAGMANFYIGRTTCARS